MRSKGTLLAAVAAVAVLAVLPASAAAKKTITMSGSTSVAPMASLLASKYVKVCDHCVSFRILQGGSDVGVADVANGRVTIGMSSRDPKSSDPGGLIFEKIAGDALCIITSPGNGLSNLDTAGVQSVFGGDVRNWNDVPGATVGGTINVIVRTAASGTQDAFLKIFMGTAKVFAGASQKASNGLVQQSVASDPDDAAIGYVSLAFTEGTNPVSYKGVACNLENAKSGQYGGLRNFYFVTAGQPGNAAGKFIKWVKTNGKAAKIIATEWVPLQ